MDVQQTIKELAQRIQETANGKAVFGEPIREGSVTIVPVSRVAVRGGGCGGTGDVPATAGEGISAQVGRGQGMGIGLYISTVPVGYITMALEGPQFVPILDRGRVVLGALAVMAVALLVGKAAIKRSKW